MGEHIFFSLQFQFAFIGSKNILEDKRWKRVLHTNRNQKKAGVAILRSNKTDFKKRPYWDKEGHYVMIKGSIQQEVITFVNIYALNIGTPKYIKQILRRKGRNRQKYNNIREL